MDGNNNKQLPEKTAEIIADSVDEEDRELARIYASERAKTAAKLGSEESQETWSEVAAAMDKDLGDEC